MRAVQGQHSLTSFDPEKVRLKAIEAKQVEKAKKKFKEATKVLKGAEAQQAQEISKADVMDVLKSDFKDYCNSLHTMKF